MLDKVKCLFSAEKEPTAATSNHPSTMLSSLSVVAMHHIYHTGGKESGFKMKELLCASLSVLGCISCSSLKSND